MLKVSFSSLNEHESHGLHGYLRQNQVWAEFDFYYKYIGDLHYRIQLGPY